MTLALNVAAMLIAFVSLIALINWPLQQFGLSLEQIFAWVFAPLAFVMGVPGRSRASWGLSSARRSWSTSSSPISRWAS